MTRNNVLQQAIDQCLKEIYKFVYPRVSWKNFKKECKEYTENYKRWEEYDKLRRKDNRTDKEQERWESLGGINWYTKSITECIGPRPYEFYYLPKNILKDICESYIYSYRLDQSKELLDTIEILKNYCKEPIVDKYIEGELREDGSRWPGHRGYDHPDNLEKEIIKYLQENYDLCLESIAIKELQDIFFKFLDMAGNFFDWNRDLNTFNTSVYLGPSPNSNKEAVIENWKKYRNKDIKINEEKMIKNYYGEED